VHCAVFVYSILASHMTPSNRPIQVVSECVCQMYRLIKTELLIKPVEGQLPGDNIRRLSDLRGD
jgi:hypothetical protein